MGEMSLFRPLDRLSRHPHRAGAGFFLAVFVAVLLTLKGQEATPLYRAARFASYRGNDLFLTLGNGALLLLALKDATRTWIAAVARVMLTQLVLVHLLKFATGPWLPRPSHSPGGFPSGHAAAAFALAFLLSERFPRGAALWYLVAGAIAWSRVEVGDHFAYQVIGGMALGLATALLLFDLSWRRLKTG